MSREQWNAEHPDHRIDQPSAPPVLQCHPPHWVPCPPSLELFHPDQNAPAITDRHSIVEYRSHVVYQSWLYALKDICDEWWPRQYYPVWTVPHPAIVFVGACLAWDPRLADAEWITQKPIEPFRIGWHPGAIDTPWSIYWQTAYERLLERLRQAIRDRTWMSSELLDQAMEQAEDAAADACSATLRNSPDYYYVLLYPGLTTTDWGPLGSTMLEHAQNRLDEEARHLFEQGRSIRSIAALLGVDRKTVQRWTGAHRRKRPTKTAP
jgi:hypothetical protein